MKIVLIYPPPIPLLTTKNDKDNHLIGLGLLYLATQVKDKHDVTILGGATNPTPVDEMIEQIAALKPDILGVSTIFSTLMVGGKIIAQEVRKRFPKTTIIFGGNHATFTARELAPEPFVDFVVKGEGEITFKELVERLDQKRPVDDVKGIVYMHGGEVIETPPREPIADIDTIPFPDWSLASDKMPKQITMCSSRGCPHDCIYCSTTAFWTRTWRARSAQNMIDEIRSVFEHYEPEKKILQIGFVDDNFTVNRKRVIEFCRLVGQQEFEIMWGCSSRIELLDDELLQIMSDAGCTDMFLGVESGSPRVLKKMNRRYTPEEVKTKVLRCMDFGILPTCSFMIGNPFEDKSDVEATLTMLKQLKSFKVQTHLFTPLIGTRVYDNSEEYGVEILTNNDDSMNLEAKALLNTRYLTAKEIEEYYHKGVGLVFKRYREAELLRKIVNAYREKRKEELLKKDQTLRLAS
jgi:radical SAM superfamily enzyme YgiQ (UPF0313 family)